MNGFRQLQEDKLLSSWKEIASSLNRGVRTVQRWEHYGLPISRPAGAGKNVVLAMESELHRWVNARRDQQPFDRSDRERVVQLSARLSIVKSQIQEIDVRLVDLQRRLEHFGRLQLPRAS